MSIDNNYSEDLNNIGWSFKEVCKFAKQIKPDNWCIVASNDRIAFIEIKLSHSGPASLQKQLILSNYLELEVYVGNNKLSDKILNTSDINSVVDLEECLSTLGRFGTCLGNRNFHRTNKTASQVKTEYWKHAQCLLVYEKDHTRKERCCDNCLSLNYFLTKKQRELVIPAVDDDDDDDEDMKPSLKRVKQEPYVEHDTRVKLEPLD
ncbi:uncharacterized protein [Leptinotarsa decemlineata]|uniref:uncharacterized protein n=1 Tax=Leptinotarsa decemlineata TaxID=7539 RepID=UPI003D3078E9